MADKHQIVDYAMTLLLVAACTIFALFFRHWIDPVNMAMFYLVAVVFIGATYGRMPSIFASLLSVTAFNFFFVEPYYSFSVHNDKYYVTFALMLAASLIVSSVATKLKLQSASVSKQNSELQALYKTASELASCREHLPISQTAIKYVESALNCKTTIFLPDDSGELKLIASSPSPFGRGRGEGFSPHNEQSNERVFSSPHPNPLPEGEGITTEIEPAKWAYSHGEPCGKYTQTLPAANGYYLPLMAQGKVVGVLGLAVKENFINQPLIAAYASLIASAIARADASKIAGQQSMEAEREKLRNTLLSSVGHDLRTPLSSITGAASTLCNQLDLSEQNASLAHSIHSQASRLNKLVSNLLDVTKMESGALSLNREPYFMDELIGSALERCKETTYKQNITLNIEKDLPLLNIDGVLIEQVLINLLENAARYSPAKSNIKISAQQTPYSVEISIADSGIGIPEGSETTIFERYKRLDEKKSEGMGLGLAICKSIVGAHGGNIWVQNSKAGGAVFTFTLPFQFNKITLPDEVI